LNAGDKMAYRLFWQCYDLAIDIDAFRHLLGRDLPHRVRALLPVLNLLGIARRQDSTIRVTDRGAYLFHLVEKEYTQAYLRTLWQACLNEAWPGRVEL